MNLLLLIKVKNQYQFIDKFRFIRTFLAKFNQVMFQSSSINISLYPPPTPLLIFWGLNSEKVYFIKSLHKKKKKIIITV